VFLAGRAVCKTVPMQPNGQPSMKRLNLWWAALLLAGAASAQGTFSEGEVGKVDVAGERLTLKHGEIKNLDLPPMTMVFRVKDPSMLARLQTGDRVRFQAERIDGRYTITRIEPAR
jgi:Cu(I)/Ag(I) efflux system periplasmic protein CusF